MDPFTQRMLERTKLRREKLEQHMNKELELGIRHPLTENNRSNELDKKESVTKNDTSAINPVQVQAKSESENWENYLPVKRKKQPELIEDTSDNDLQKNEMSRPKFGRLAALATKIKEWEDELDKPKSTTSNENTKLLEKGKVAKTTEKTVLKEKKSEKQVVWDKTIIKSLESQGYALSQNESRLIYEFERGKGIDPAKSESAASTTNLPSSPCKRVDSEVSIKDGATKRPCGNSPRVNSENKDSAVLKKAAFFESHNKSSPVKVEKDPTELSISERKALFEKNAGEALLPKVAFATPLPAKLAIKWTNEKNTEKPNLAVNSGTSQPNKNFNPVPNKSEVPVKVPVKSSEGMEIENKVKLQKEKFEKVIGTESKEQLRNDIVFRELEHLRNCWNRCKNLTEKEESKIPEPPPMPAVSITSPPAPVVVEPKPILSPSKPVEKKVDEMNKNDSGRLYPSLSDFEKSDDSDRPETDSESLDESKNSNMYLNMSFSDILEAKRNDPTSSNEHSFNAELRESQVLSKMDEFLDNALNDLSSTDEGDSDDENAPTPPKMLKSSSFVYKSNADEAEPLMHTVSFYRKQQQISINNQTPTSVKSIKREEKPSDNAVVEGEEILVEKKIQDLLQEINKQQTIISQASQALNLCLSTVEFSNSGEQVESERLLLLANHKRQACLNEIQRLKVENSIRPKGSNHQLTEKGDLIISNVSIPLKRDALRAMAAVESMQYLVCLIKSDERVIATPAVPATRENLKNTVLHVPGQYKLEKLFSDFKVTIEVYHLELSKEMLPHEVKYHIVNKKEKKLLTPIKSKKTESKLVMPCVQSPAGPNAVRSSNFHLGGYLVFSLREVTRTNWTLNKVPYTSPLEGSFSMKIESQLQLDAEFRGFLTMFDDISGFGAWHRRWCLLSSHTLSYWKYPDDETRKVPIGTIDLRGVVTENVGLVSRDICARLHTFLLETTRPRQSDDKESLVLNIQGEITRIRHLLSADSKEEMLAWCKKLNTTLALLRSWRCNLDV